jgi:Ribosomal protein L14E/L6E/L27E
MKRSDMPEVTSCIGSIAVSTAGRDRYRKFMIIGLCEGGAESGMVLIADGKLRLIEAPKQKKLRHLKIIECGNEERAKLIESDSVTNKFLRELLSAYA